jgi:hypothetical protein
VGRRLGQGVDERRGGALPENNSKQTRVMACGGLGPELGLEGHHCSPGRETEGESACAYRLCCARARCGAGLAAAAPLARAGEREGEGDLSAGRGRRALWP